MIQQVNLYKDILNQGQKKSGINLYAVGAVAVALLFIGLSAFLMSNLKKAETQVQQLRQELIAEQGKVSVISSKTPIQEINPQLGKDIGQWQTMVDELAQAVQILSGKTESQTPGFSGYFLALSNQAIPEVWLSALHIDATQHIIDIEGSSFRPDKIPYFLKQLQKEPIFNGHTFAKMIMQQSEEMPGQIDFTLSTNSEVPDKK